MTRNIYQFIPPHRLSIIQSRATRNISTFRESVVSRHGITSPEWFVLGYVAHETPHGGTKVGDIASVLDVQSTYVTGILRKLEAKNLLRTASSARDRRVRMVTTTEKGTKLAKQIENDFVEYSKKYSSVRLSEGPGEDILKGYVGMLELLSQENLWPPLQAEQR